MRKWRTKKKMILTKEKKRKLKKRKILKLRRELKGKGKIMKLL